MSDTPAHGVPTSHPGGEHENANGASLRPVTLSPQAAEALATGEEETRVVPFPHQATLGGERWSATLPVAAAARQQWGLAREYAPAAGARPTEVRVAQDHHPAPEREAVLPLAHPEEGRAISASIPSVIDSAGAAPASPDGNQAVQALVTLEQAVGHFRPLSTTEGEHIAWMRTWLDERLSQPGNGLVGRSPEEQIRQAIAALNAVLPALADPIPNEFVPLARAYLFGGGPLDEWLHMPGVTDVVVNGLAGVFVKIGGNWTRVSDGLANDEIVRIVNLMTGRHLTMAEPSIEAQTLAGGRLSALHPVLTRGQAALALRLFPRRYTLDELVHPQQMLTEEAARFCRDAVRGRLGIVVAGGTGMGKTTFLNALLGIIPPEERLVIIEDGTPELACSLPNVIYLQTRKGTLDSKAAGLDATVTATELLERALRFAPDRIFVGECRGREAYAWLQTVNTGHPGSMTTVHSDFGALPALRRMQGMVLLAASGLPAEEIRYQLAEAIQLVLMTAQQQGQRYLRQIIQVVPSPDAQHGFTHSSLFEARPEEGLPLARVEVLESHLADRMRVWGVRPDPWLVLPPPQYRS